MYLSLTSNYNKAKKLVSFLFLFFTLFIINCLRTPCVKKKKRFFGAKISSKKKKKMESIDSTNTNKKRKKEWKDELNLDYPFFLIILTTFSFFLLSPFFSRKDFFFYMYIYIYTEKKKNTATKLFDDQYGSFTRWKEKTSHSTTEIRNITTLFLSFSLSLFIRYFPLFSRMNALSQGGKLNC